MIKKLTLLSFIVLGSLLFYVTRNQPAQQDEEAFTTPRTQEHSDLPSSQELNEKTTELNKNENQVTKEEDAKTPAPAVRKAPPTIFERDQHPYNEEGELMVSQVLVIEEYAVAHGDILIGTYDEMLELEKRGLLPTMPEPGLWENGVIPYFIDPDYSYPERIKKVISYYHQETPIRFIPWDGYSDDHVVFTSGPEHCFAHLGRRGGPQKVVLSSGCFEAEIAHEIMHVLGFLHEQNREDRDNYLSVHWDNIEEVYHEQFKKMPNPFTAGFQLPFDLNSIMIYSPFSFAIDPNRPSMTRKNGELFERSNELLSPGDIKKIEALYGKKPHPR